jgi:hypothetical protein
MVMNGKQIHVGKVVVLIYLKALSGICLEKLRKTI